MPLTFMIQPWQIVYQFVSGELLLKEHKSRSQYWLYCVLSAIVLGGMCVRISFVFLGGGGVIDWFFCF